MLLNFNAPRTLATSITPTSNTFDVNSALGLKTSPYEGLKTVGNTGYYYGDNKMYEPYTITRSMAQPSSNPLDALRSSWSYVTLPTGQTVVSNYHPEYGGQSPYTSNEASGTIMRGDQAFRPVNVDIPGFNKTTTDDVTTYDPSMAYLSAMRPTYTPNQALGANQALSLLSPTSGGYGAGAYLGNNGLMGLNFAAPTGTATTGQ